MRWRDGPEARRPGQYRPDPVEPNDARTERAPRKRAKPDALPQRNGFDPASGPMTIRQDAARAYRILRRIRPARQNDIREFEPADVSA